MLRAQASNRSQRRQTIAAQPELQELLRPLLLQQNQRDYRRRYGRPKEYPVHSQDINKPRPFKLFHLF